MRFVRPYDVKSVRSGEAGPWLIAPEEGVGVSVRLRRGGTANIVAGDEETYALVIEGELSIRRGDATQLAGKGNVAFTPVGDPVTFEGTADTLWVEISAPAACLPTRSGIDVIKIDESRFQGTGFAYQQLIGREDGALALRMNLMQVEPGAGSPDFHIHAFAQIYLIEQGEMTIDIGRGKHRATAPCIVLLPPGAVHRNYNAAGEIERHISLLVPEPAEGDIFDFAVKIEDREAELMTAIPVAADQPAY